MLLFIEPSCNQQAQLSEVVLIGLHELVQKVRLVFTIHPDVLHLGQGLFDASNDPAEPALAEDLMSDEQPLGDYVYVLTLRVLEVVKVEADVFELLEILLIARDISDTIEQLLSFEVLLEVVRVVQPREVLIQIVVLQYLHSNISILNGSKNTHSKQYRLSFI